MSVITTLLAKVVANRYVIIASLVLALFGSAYIYYLRTTIKIERLEKENKQLQQIVVEQKTVIESLRENYAKILASKEELEKSIANTRKDLENLRNTLYRENKKKKSLEELARKKTSLIQKKVNAATKKVLKCFEIISVGGDC